MCRFNHIHFINTDISNVEFIDCIWVSSKHEIPSSKYPSIIYHQKPQDSFCAASFAGETPQVRQSYVFAGIGFARIIIRHGHNYYILSRLGGNVTWKPFTSPQLTDTFWDFNIKSYNSSDISFICDPMTNAYLHISDGGILSEMIDIQHFAIARLAATNNIIYQCYGNSHGYTKRYKIWCNVNESRSSLYCHEITTNNYHPNAETELALDSSPRYPFFEIITKPASNCAYLRIIANGHYLHVTNRTVSIVKSNIDNFRDITEWTVRATGPVTRSTNVYDNDYVGSTNDYVCGDSSESRPYMTVFIDQLQYVLSCGANGLFLRPCDNGENDTLYHGAIIARDPSWAIFTGI